MGCGYENGRATRLQFSPEGPRPRGPGMQKYSTRSLPLPWLLPVREDADPPVIRAL